MNTAKRPPQGPNSRAAQTRKREQEQEGRLERLGRVIPADEVIRRLELFQAAQIAALERVAVVIARTVGRERFIQELQREIELIGGPIAATPLDLADTLLRLMLEAVRNRAPDGKA